MMNYDLFVAACRNAKSCEFESRLIEDEFNDILKNGAMYHQYEDVSVLFYPDSFGEMVCMTVDGDETYKFESYTTYRELMDDWED